MLYNVVVNDWGETTYVPTTLGNVLLVLLIVALLAAALFLVGRRSTKNRRLSVRQLTCCAMSLALGTILSSLKLFSFPWGGSVTVFSMLIICLPGYWFGLGAGILTGAAYGVLQLLSDPYVLYPLQLVTDYLLAFGAMGLSGLFRHSENGLIKGYLTAVLGRYAFAVISGWIFFGSYAWEGWAALPYSLIYNGIYIFAEAAITLILLAVPAVRQMLLGLRNMLNET